MTPFHIDIDLTNYCLEQGVTTWIVTHIKKYAKELYREGHDDVLFLSAGRQADKEVRFTMYEKEPGDTSYGLELYEQMIESGK